jgi:hypothetical protein
MSVCIHKDKKEARENGISYYQGPKDGFNDRYGDRRDLDEIVGYPATKTAFAFVE